MARPQDTPAAQRSPLAARRGRGHVVSSSSCLPSFCLRPHCLHPLFHLDIARQLRPFFDRQSTGSQRHHGRRPACRGRLHSSCRLPSFCHRRRFPTLFNFALSHRLTTTLLTFYRSLTLSINQQLTCLLPRTRPRRSPPTLQLRPLTAKTSVTPCSRQEAPTELVEVPTTPARNAPADSPPPLILLDTPPLEIHTPKRRVSLLLGIHFNGLTRPADTLRRASRGGSRSPL